MSVGKCFTAWRLVKQHGGEACLEQPIQRLRARHRRRAQSSMQDAKPSGGARQKRHQALSKHTCFWSFPVHTLISKMNTANPLDLSGPLEATYPTMYAQTAAFTKQISKHLTIQVLSRRHVPEEVPQRVSSHWPGIF